MKLEYHKFHHDIYLDGNCVGLYPKRNKLSRLDVGKVDINQMLDCDHDMFGIATQVLFAIAFDAGVK